MAHCFLKDKQPAMACCFLKDSGEVRIEFCNSVEYNIGTMCFLMKTQRTKLVFSRDMKVYLPNHALILSFIVDCCPNQFDLRFRKQNMLKWPTFTLEVGAFIFSFISSSVDRICFLEHLPHSHYQGLANLSSNG